VILPPLTEARLLRRYKRFLADVTLPGEVGAVTVHCPNPGAMTGLDRPGSRVWLAPGAGRLPWRLTLVEADDTLVGIDTGLPNRLAEEAIRAGLLDAFGPVLGLRREVRLGHDSRVDLVIHAASGPPIHVEVKNVHLVRRQGLAEFPDCVTLRGAKHLRALAEVVRAGGRAAMLYVVQRGDCREMALARDLDPGYFRAFCAARAAGVEAYAIACRVTPSAIVAADPLPLRHPH
jgi:sugar fermentation stimulation protein A